MEHIQYLLKANFLDTLVSNMSNTAFFSDSFTDIGALLGTNDFLLGEIASTGQMGYLRVSDLPVPVLPAEYSLTAVTAVLPAPAASTDYFFGSLAGLAPQLTANMSPIYIPKDGAIKSAYIELDVQTVGSVENMSIYIRLNNTSDTLIQAAPAQSGVFSNTGLDIAVVVGDYIEIKVVCPAWLAAPLNLSFGGQIYIE